MGTLAHRDPPAGPVFTGKTRTAGALVDSSDIRHPRRGPLGDLSLGSYEGGQNIQGVFSACVKWPI